MKIKINPNERPETQLSKDLKKDLVAIIEEKEEIYLCINCKLSLQRTSERMGVNGFIKHVKKHEKAGHIFSDRTIKEIERLKFLLEVKLNEFSI